MKKKNEDLNEVKDQKENEEQTEIFVAKNECDEPRTVYKKRINKTKRTVVILTIFVLLMQSIVASVLLADIYIEDYHLRITREFQNSSFGQITTSNGKYEGETLFGYFDGTGIYKFDSGVVYEGEWKNNFIDGIGKLQLPIEGIYEGSFSKGVKCGNGTFKWDDGTIYVGEWKDDQMCGQGTYTTANDVVYSGTFENNILKLGTCEFKNETGEYIVSYKESVIDTVSITYKDGTTYNGTCTEVDVTGNGVMSFPNGDEYTGNLASDLRNGSGVYKWNNGDSYDGEWLNDYMEGTGKYSYADGSYASGTFEKNVFIKGTYYVKNSFGEYTFEIENGEPTYVDMILTNGTKYSGSMEDGKLDGQAQIEYSNGDKYSGTIFNGQKSGSGVYEWASGAKYDGNWSLDRMNGNGTYTYSSNEDGYKLTGEFKEGKPDGVCTYYVSLTEYYKTDWKNGVCVKVYE